MRSAHPQITVGLTAILVLCLSSAEPGEPDRPRGRRTEAAPALEGLRVLRDIEYVSGGGKARSLDLYIPEKADVPLPLVIWIHGGAFLAGDKSPCQAASLARRGFAVASINYRLSQEARFPAQIEDCKAAVRWLRAHAAEYKLDPARFGAWGASAGGHLAAMLGTSGEAKDLEGDGGNLEVSSRVQAVCDWFGPTDFLQMDAHRLNDQAQRHDPAASPESRLVGGPIQENKDKVRRANPITYVTADDPPFLILHGDLDPLVPHHQSVLLDEALRAAKVEVTFHTVKGAGHGFGGPEIDREVEEFFEKHLKKADGGGKTPLPETAGGWRKSEANPVLGGDLGTCFDVSVLEESGTFRMWFSWRPRKSVALVESKDGIRWGEPRIVLGPNDGTTWEGDINRPVVLRHEGRYLMWYTGQARGQSWIGHATSPDGRTWSRAGKDPVLSPEAAWERVAVMCPHVIWDGESRVFRMWYSGGEQNEPNAIGYATSPDGVRWTKSASNPVFRPDPANEWEKDRVTACQVIPRGEWYLMFYIGFRDEERAQIGVARSRDGLTGWERHRANPIIRPGKDRWDHDAVYKPYAVLHDGRWLLWYNGRRGAMEQIGLAIHDGEDLGF